MLESSAAGKHEFEVGPRIVFLIPQFQANGFGEILFVVSSGVVDGRVIVSAFALERMKLVVCSRILTAPETVLRPKYREAFPAARQCSLSTIQDKLFDGLKGLTI